MISRVSDDTGLTARVRAAADAIDDQLGSDIQQRVPENMSLLEKGAIYHNVCWTDLFRRAKRRRESVSRPVDLDNFAKFELIFKENSKEKQVVFDDLYARLGDNAPTRRYFKEKLQERLGDELIFSSRGSGKTVIIMSKYLDEILLHHYQSIHISENERQSSEVIKKCTNTIRADIWDKDYGK